MKFLFRTGKLRIDESDPDKYYSTELWGTTLSAARDAVIIFRKVLKNTDGTIKDIDFSLIAKSEIKKLTILLTMSLST